MTTNTTLVAAAAAVALTLDHRGTLDELPTVCGFAVERDGDGDDRPGIAMQCASVNGGGAEQEVRALLAWRSALGDTARIEAEPLGGAWANSGTWAVQAVGRVAGVRVRVWDHVTPGADVDAALRSTGGPLAAGALLVQLVVTDGEVPA